MSILSGAGPSGLEPLIITICGAPGSGKSTVAASFPKPFLIRTTGEAVPRDIPVDQRPAELGETGTPDQLWEQLKALAREDHEYKTLIIDSVSGLENLFVQSVLDSDPKAKSIQQAGGGYGAGRGMVTAMHLRVRKAAEIMRKRGMNVVFVAHSDIIRIEPPDAESYTSYSLRLHDKSMSGYVDSVDVVGFLKQETIVTGDERKRAISDGSRVLVTYLTPSNISKNRLGIHEDLPVEHGKNPLAAWIVPEKARRGRPPKTVAAADTPADDEIRDAMQEGVN